MFEARLLFLFLLLHISSSLGCVFEWSRIHETVIMPFTSARDVESQHAWEDQKKLDLLRGTETHCGQVVVHGRRKKSWKCMEVSTSSHYAYYKLRGCSETAIWALFPARVGQKCHSDCHQRMLPQVKYCARLTWRFPDGCSSAGIVSPNATNDRNISGHLRRTGQKYGNPFTPCPYLCVKFMLGYRNGDRLGWLIVDSAKPGLQATLPAICAASAELSAAQIRPRGYRPGICNTPIVPRLVMALQHLILRLVIPISSDLTDSDGLPRPSSFSLPIRCSFTIIKRPLRLPSQIACRAFPLHCWWVLMLLCGMPPSPLPAKCHCVHRSANMQIVSSRGLYHDYILKRDHVDSYSNPDDEIVDGDALK